MKEIPILFSTPMVQAELDGRKTNTRRLKNLEVINENSDKWSFQEKFTHVGKYERDKHVYRFVDGKGSFMDILCPFGRPGDLLWVRESFRVNTWMHEDGEVNFRYEADGALSPFIWFEDGDDKMPFNRYWEQSCVDLSKAGYEPNEEERYSDYDYKALRLRPNIFMPKEAARIWLQVTDVRVERLKDITEIDAIAEGVEKRPGSSSSTKFDYRHYEYERSYNVDAKVSFRTLWEKINGADSWAANPWVWVVSFKVLSTTGKPDLQSIKAV